MKTILLVLFSLCTASALVAQTPVPPGNYIIQRRQFLPGTAYNTLTFAPVSNNFLGFDASGNPLLFPASAYQPSNSNLTALSGLSMTAYGQSLLTQSGSVSLINSLLPSQVSGEFLTTDGTNWMLGQALKPSNVSGSLIVSGGFLTLLGDSGSPGNTYYYGTNGSGVKGWYAIPSQVNADWSSSSGPSQILNKPTIPAAQVNSDWNSVTGVSQILNKPSLATVATTGAFADLSGTGNVVQTTGSYSNPAWITGLAWSKISGSPTTLSGYGITDAYPLSGNPSGFLTGITSGQVTTALGYTPYNATNPSSYITQAGARSAVSLTTTGTSGAATYNSSTGVLNVPNYAVTGGTVTSITAGTGLSGGTITTTGTISMPNTGTAGTYVSVTTDAQGRVTSGNAMSVNNAPGRSLVTVAAAANGWQVSATRNSEVRYSVTIVSTASLSGAQSGYVVLEICPTNSSTAGDWIEIGRVSNGQSVALAIALTAIATGGGQVNGTVPAGYYVRARSVNSVGTPTFTLNSQQEILY